MEIIIDIDLETISYDKVRKLLERQPNWFQSGNKIELVSFRGTDPTILVAVVGAVSTGLGALITGLLQVAQQSSARKIVIESEKGVRLEFPSDTKPEKIDLLIEKAKQLDAPKIIVQ